MTAPDRPQPITKQYISKTTVFRHKFPKCLKVFILVGQDNLFGPTYQLQGPSYIDVWVVPEYAIVKLSIKFFAAFVGDDGVLQNKIAVGTASRNQNLIMFFTNQVEG